MSGVFIIVHCGHIIIFYDKERLGVFVLLYRRNADLFLLSLIKFIWLTSILLDVFLKFILYKTKSSH